MAEPRVMMSPNIPRQGCVIVQRAVGVISSIAFPPFLLGPSNSGPSRVSGENSPKEPSNSRSFAE